MERFEINIAGDYSINLGGRFERLGPFSGERFYNEKLKEKFENAIKSNEKLHIFLDGTTGYGSSFLDQSFGELGRTFGVEKVYNNIIFHTNSFNWEVKYLKEEIWGIK